jgi:hypothetical protein
MGVATSWEVTGPGFPKVSHTPVGPPVCAGGRAGRLSPLDPLRTFKHTLPRLSPPGSRQGHSPWSPSVGNGLGALLWQCRNGLSSRQPKRKESGGCASAVFGSCSGPRGPSHLQVSGQSPEVPSLTQSPIDRGREPRPPKPPCREPLRRPAPRPAWAGTSAGRSTSAPLR